MTNIIAISSPAAPAAIGPYSQAVLASDFLYVSGQLPVRPGETNLVEGDTAAQAEQVITNLAAILNQAGLGLDAVVKATVFLVDLNDFAAVNDVYSRHFNGSVLPARSTVQVVALPKGASVEIEVVAHRVAPTTAGA
jgi:2-iminobutanoate/2-iminopropanoate deaminase